MNRKLKLFRQMVCHWTAIISFVGSVGLSGCSPRPSTAEARTWHGQLRDGRFGSAPGIELTGKPGALSGSLFLVPGEKMDPFDAKLKLPTTVVKQSEKE